MNTNETIQFNAHAAERYSRILRAHAQTLTKRAQCSLDWNEQQRLHRIAGDCMDLSAMLIDALVSNTPVAGVQSAYGIVPI